MKNYLVHYSWSEGKSSGVGRAFLSLDVRPSSEDILKLEEMMSEKQNQMVLVLGFTSLRADEK